MKGDEGALSANPRRRVALQDLGKPVQYPSVTLSNRVAKQKLLTENFLGGYENAGQGASVGFVLAGIPCSMRKKSPMMTF